MRLPPLLPALAAALLAAGAPAALHAQSDSGTVRTAAVLRAAPEGRRVLVVREGARVALGDTKGDWVQVTVQGWVPRSALGGRVGDFSISVRGGKAATLRASASGSSRALASIGGGTGLRRVSTRGNWVQVRRTGWMSRDLVRGARTATAAGEVERQQRRAAPQRASAASTAKAKGDGADTARAAATTPPADSAAAATDSAAAASAPAERRVRATGQAAVHGTPGGAALATLAPGAEASPVARDGEWVKVRLEGWVRADQLGPGGDAPRLAAADLKADPAAALGKRVEWVVELMALQRADTLRRDLMPGEPYLLSRGPEGENAILYLAVPPAMLEQVRQLPLPTRAVVVARVRSGRSLPAGVPVLDLESLTRR